MGAHSDAADLPEHWADNQVSITVTFKKEETQDIATCLEAFETSLKSVSLLPLGDDDHGYVQAPYIAISKKEYENIEKTNENPRKSANIIRKPCENLKQKYENNKKTYENLSKSLKIMKTPTKT